MQIANPPLARCLVRLNCTDAATLARAAKESGVGADRRRQVFEEAAQQVKAIGDILITGDQARVAADPVCVAHNHRAWADAERFE
jgi:hypothetical protein